MVAKKPAAKAIPEDNSTSYFGSARKSDAKGSGRRTTAAAPKAERRTEVRRLDDRLRVKRPK